jgi:hypothetical protein
MKSATYVASIALFASLVASTGCETIDKVNKAIDESAKTMKEAQGFIKSMRKTADLARQSATTPVSGATPAQTASVEPPKGGEKTGGVDLAAPVDGQTGQVLVDLDEDGSEEMVDVILVDSGALYYWGSIDGVCFVLLDDGSAVYAVFNDCEATDGAYVCVDDGSEIDCDACNVAGECEPCTEESCEIPEVSEEEVCLDDTSAEACDDDLDCCDGLVCGALEEGNFCVVPA